MLKKKLYTALSFVFCCFAATGTYGQAAIEIPQANIVLQNEYAVNAANGSFTAVLGLLPSISVRSSTATIPSISSGTNSSLPLNIVNIKAFSIGPGIGLLEGAIEVPLTTNYQSIFTALAKLLSTGTLVNTYRISIVGLPWIAGIYSTPLNFTGSLLTAVDPPTQALQITVPAFITPSATALPTTVLRVNSLSFFRNPAGVSNSSTFNYSTSVPTLINLRATGSNFAFTTTQQYNQLPANPNINVLTANVTDPLTAGTVTLSNSDQLLTASTGLPVIVTNNKTITSNLNISGPNLKNNFVQAGTYTVPVTYTVAKTAAAYPASLAPATISNDVQVVVDNMSELTVQDASVTLNFLTQAAYQNGVSLQMPNHIKLSSTVPYSVSVKASSTNFSTTTSGVIPVSVLTIGGGTLQPGITPVSLSTTPQSIITAGNPVIDGLLNLQYSIPVSQTPKLLGQPPGTYSTTITYTITAP